MHDNAGRIRLPTSLADLEGLVVNLGVRPVPTFDVYVGRTFAGRVDEGWGNPVRLRADSPERRAEAVAAYWQWLNGPSRAARRARHRVRSGELTAKVLGCWCAGKGLCHGHVLAGVANGRVEAVRAWMGTLQAGRR